MTYNLAPRKPLRGAARDAFLEAHGRICYYCQMPIFSGQIWHDEHIVARELGGSDDMSNRKPIHADPCHKQKTAWDRKQIAKSNRLIRRNGPIEARKVKKPIPSRPFQRKAK